MASEKPCDFCKGRAYTKKPVTIITAYGKRFQMVFEHCPSCGRKLRSEKTYQQFCPFCGKDHEQRMHINIICNCGAKYYFRDNTWLDRKTGCTKQGVNCRE